MPILLHCRYTVMAGTPEKILEHFLETMRLDSQFAESGINILWIQTNRHMGIVSVLR